MKLASLLQQHESAVPLFLNRLPGIRSRRWPHLLLAIKKADPSLLLEASPQQLFELGFPKEALSALMECRGENISKQKMTAGVLADLTWLDKPRRQIILRGDEQYPPLLEQIFDPPNLLFVEGDASVLLDIGVAIVGARNPSLLGRERAFQFAERFSQAAVVTVSGLALGIDAQAHRGALHGNGKTVGVLAGGLDQIYPKQHLSLAKSIAENGAVISEMPVDVAAAPYLFPRRNRIISGLSVATLVIEAALRSGSLITARYAMEQGRDVFAMPGSVLNPLAAGCHNLIRQGAGLVENGEQVLEAIGCWSPLFLSSAESAPNASLEQSLHILLDKMGFDPVPIDTLAGRTGLSIPTLTQQLLELELEGQVQSCAGGFVRVA